MTATIAEYDGWSEANPKVDGEEFLALALIEWNDLVFTEALNERAEQYRRTSVREGRIEPTADDIDWLTEERDNMIALAKPYDRALQLAQTRAGKND